VFFSRTGEGQQIPQLVEKAGTGSKLSCSCQDRQPLDPPAKPRQRNALGPKPRCSLQAAAPSVAIRLQLLLAVLFGGPWILLPVLFRIIAVNLAPFTLAVTHPLCVLSVCGEPHAVIVRPSLALASSTATHGLVGTVHRGLRRLLTKAAATGRQAVFSSGLEMTLGDLR